MASGAEYRNSQKKQLKCVMRVFKQIDYMPRTLIELSGHDNAGHLQWVDADTNKYTSVSSALQSRLYAVSNNMQFAGTLGLDTMEQQYYMNTSCSNCSGNCRCSDCRTQEDMETDFSIPSWQQVKDGAAAAAHKAGQLAGSVKKSVANAVEAVKAGHAAAQESLDPGGMKRLAGQVTAVEKDENRALADLGNIDETKLTTEQQENIRKVKLYTKQAQEALEDLASGLRTVVAAAVTAAT